jgi:hypothetical protein
MYRPPFQGTLLKMNYVRNSGVLQTWKEMATAVDQLTQEKTNLTVSSTEAES